jgi:MFS family permease
LGIYDNGCRMTEWRDLLAGRWQAFALIMLGMWLMAADSLVTATIMPSVGAGLGGYAWFGWATSGYLIGLVVAGACAGWLSDRFGCAASWRHRASFWQRGAG